MVEEWKEVPNCPKFEVSNHGRIRTWKEHKYLSFGKLITLKGKDGKHNTYGVGMLVARLFLPNPDNCKRVRRIDGDSFNHHVQNLEWIVTKTRVSREVEDIPVVIPDEVRKSIRDKYHHDESLCEILEIVHSVDESTLV